MMIFNKKNYTRSLIVALIALSQLSYAQFKVSGTVSDAADGLTIPSANIIVKNTLIGTTTNMDGYFEFEVPSGQDTLVISYLGYQNKEVIIKHRSSINIQLSTEATLIDDVVVTALGVKREKKSLGYSVQEVKGEELQTNKEVSVINTLSGKVAGLQVSATTGGAASSSRVVLRGNNSFNSNQALIVVDGVPIENSTTSSSEGEWGGKDFGNGISDINPDDIESVSVLKGASASALYGSRAANGVILITTKKGDKKKKISVQFRTAATLDFAYIHKKFQNEFGAGSDGKFQTHWRTDTATGKPVYYSDQANYYSSWGPRMNGQSIIDWDGQERTFSPQEDNYKNYFQTGYTANNSVAIGGSLGENTIRLTYADLRNKDIIPGAKVRRSNLGLNTSLKFFKKLEINAYLSYVNQRADNRPGLSDDHTNPARNYILMPRHISSESLENYTMNAAGEEQTWYSAWNWQTNPYWNELYELDYDQKHRAFGNISATYKHNENLSFLVRHAEDYSNHYFENITAYNGMLSSTGGFSHNTIKRWQYNTDFLATYTKELNKSFTVTGNIGGSAFYEQFDEHYEQTEGGLNVPYDYSIANSANIPTIRPYFKEKAVNSLYAFGQIDYKHFLFLDITGRNDWSSTLPENNNSYFYPSYSMGFVFTELIDEKSKILKYLPYGKLRASWAKVGNDTDPYQLDMTYYIDTNNVYGTYAYLNKQIPPADLKPEELVSKEIGTDLRFFKNRIGVDFTWYQTNSFNQIVRVNISSASGSGRAMINAGNIENKGVELQLKLDVVKSKKFKWFSTINYTKNNSKVLELSEGIDNLLILDHWNLSIEARPGNPYGDIVGYGIKRDSYGNKLVNENGMYIRTDSTVVLGNINPDFSMSWSNTFKYKKLSLSFLIDARFGGEMFSGTNMYGNGYAGNFEESLEGRDEWYASEAAREKAGVSSENWTATGGMQAEGVYAEGTIIDGVDMSGKSNTTYVNPEDYWHQFSEWTHEIHEPFVYDASFIKLRELSISYELPVNLTKKLKMESLTVSLIARNLWLIYSNTPNVDPESFHTNGNGQGYELYAYPTRRSFGASLTLKF